MSSIHGHEVLQMMLASGESWTVASLEASIHGHEVLQMMLASGESWTVASLEAAIRRRFGEEARFHTCSAEHLSAAELVAFLEKKGKFIAREEGFTTAENKICRH